MFNVCLWKASLVTESQLFHKNIKMLAKSNLFTNFGMRNHANFMHLKGISINTIINLNILTDSVPPPSSLCPPKYQVIWAGGLEPVLLQTTSDSLPTTSRSTLLTIFTVTGATVKKIWRVGSQININIPVFFFYKSLNKRTNILLKSHPFKSVNVRHWRL